MEPFVGVKSQLVSLWRTARTAAAAAAAYRAPAAPSQEQEGWAARALARCEDRQLVRKLQRRHGAGEAAPRCKRVGARPVRPGYNSWSSVPLASPTHPANNSKATAKPPLRRRSPAAPACQYLPPLTFPPPTSPKVMRRILALLLVVLLAGSALAETRRTRSGRRRGLLGSGPVCEAMPPRGGPTNSVNCGSQCTASTQQYMACCDRMFDLFIVGEWAACLLPLWATLDCRGDCRPTLALRGG